MPHERSEEASWWFDAVYSAVQEVPTGKVTTYKHIAVLLGEPKRSRQVGVCLKHLPSHNSEGRHLHHDANVPWQRIINSKGMISPRGPGSAQRQATALRRERVNVTRNAMGEHCIDLSEYGWFPRCLPSEEGQEESEVEDGNDNDQADNGEQAQVETTDEPDETTTDQTSNSQRSGAANRGRNRNRRGNIHL